MQSTCRFLLAAIGTALLTVALPARASQFNYFIGIDDLPTLTSGTYSGMPNPNFNRLTFLWGHPSSTNPSSSHYHSKGIFIYTGPATAPTIINSTSDYVPEGSIAPLKLTLGTGIYAGKLVSNPYTDLNDPAYNFSDLTIGSTQSLAGEPDGSAELFLFNSSGGRWNSLFEEADLHFELVSLTPGLHIGGLTSLDIGLNVPGNDYHLASGTENNSFSFTPVLYTDANAAPGIYEAAFKLVDESGTFGDSGVIRIRTEVVPEPSTAILLLCGAAVVAARRRRAPAAA